MSDDFFGCAGDTERREPALSVIANGRVRVPAAAATPDRAAKARSSAG